MNPILLTVGLVLCCIFIFTGFYIRIKRRPVSGIPFIVAGIIGIVVLLIYSFFFT